MRLLRAVRESLGAARLARVLAAGVAFVAVTAMVALRGLPARELPGFGDVRAAWCPSDVRVLDRHGKPLHEVRIDPSVRRLAWTPLAEVSPALVGAVLASEDRRFASHHGVDWRATAAAAVQRLRGGPPRGASTITMQVAAFLDPPLRRGARARSLVAKAQQMRTAQRLEEHWSKDEILEAYLNMVTFRGEVQGVRAAADAIFAKVPHGLSLAESVVLATSLRAPNAGAGALRVRAVALADAIEGVTAAIDGGDLDLGRDAGAIDDAVARASNSPDSRGPGAATALHAARRLAAGAPPCQDIPSSLDATTQLVAENSIRRRLVELRDRSARDGAVLVVDNATGEVLAYVGSSGSLSKTSQVDGVRARRQAGSTLKPFLYASAIERGLLTPATLLEDMPLDVALEGGVYRPANYDEAFRGLVSARTALAASLNVPAVRTLLLVGDDAFARTLRSLGFSSVTEAGSFYGPSLALGSADVSLWELVGAYRALANGGVWSPLRWTTASGDTGDSYRGTSNHAGISHRGTSGDTGDPRRVFGADTAFLIGDMISDRESRATTFGLENALATPFWTAVKTGTSKDMRDNWCIGYSRRYTVGVWVGNFSGESMHDVSGVAGAAPVWEDVMNALHDEAASSPPERPADVVEAWTRFAGNAEPARSERYRRGSEPVSADRGLDTVARIVAPTDGSILAVDPDIPPSRQRVPLTVRSARAGLTWKLDDTALGSAASPRLWEPTSGRHRLELLDEAGRPVDVVRFDVRGTTARDQRQDRP